MKSARSSRKVKARLALLDGAAGSHRQEGKFFPIVGIGASAGGLEAFTQLLGHLPRKTNMAFVLVQHLAPKHESALTDLLSRVTQIPVTEVKDGMVVEPDCVYVIPPNVNMGIRGGRLHLMPRAPDQQHLPVDFLLRSLAEERGSKAIGVILSGTASDGTLGVKAIKAEGGITFAQDEKSAKYGDMPRNAIATGSIDFVLPPAGIAHELVEIAHHPYLQQAHAQENAEIAGELEGEMRKILLLLRTATGVDFTHYKQSTIKRRIKRRMMLQRAGTLREYIKRLQESRAELDALYQDILIHVTGFFRDPEVFEGLKTQIFPNLLKHRASGEALRVWVPGCSTGEEVYSIVISLLEYLGDTSSSMDIQIFATDISEPALEKARAGVYEESIAADVSSERLRRFFAKTARGYQVNKAIRDACVFARQDLVKDPPFSRLDLISCRNLLIYLGAVLQKKVLPTFHYALKPTGYLLLGNSETIGGNGEHFSIVDRKHKIYAKKPLPTRLAAGLPRSGYAPERADLAKKSEEVGSPFDIQKEAERILLARYAPAGVIVNGDLEILQFRGHTGAFLEPAPGQAGLTLPKMAREGLLVDVRAAIQKARKEDAPARKQGIRIKRDGRLLEVDIEVIPIKSPNSAERWFLVLFEEAPPPKTNARKISRRESGRGSIAQSAHERQVIQLQEELAHTKSTLQSIIEEQETTNEELKSANEEILSSNEELQSTNEELETAKEELQSTNEELTTLNEELQNRNVELSVANNDLLNLLASANIPILMLGNDLRIRHFTPPTEKLLNLIPSDMGRPIGDLRPNLAAVDLEQSISDAIDTVSVKEREVQDLQGRWYSMRIRPYITSENKIDGAVISWIDISGLKETQAATERALGQVEDRNRVLIEGDLAGIYRVSRDGRYLDCNPAFARILGYASAAEVMAHNARDLWCVPAEWEAFSKRLEAAHGPLNVETRMRRKDGTPVWVMNNAVLVDGQEGAEGELQGMVVDITERKNAEASISRLSSQLLGSQEAERRRVSRALHDVTGSGLAAIIANLALLRKTSQKPDKKARRALVESLKLAKQCSQQIRTVSYLLHPPLLDELGLVSALRWYAEGFAERSRVHVSLDLPPELGRLRPDVEASLFAIVQESLTNVHLHSGSPTAHIRMTLAENELTLEVMDDGKGLSAKTRKASGSQVGKFREGVGIAGMRERMSQLGGRLEIISGKKGTTVKAVLPRHPTDKA
jgi:two-component system CheB/CheR fusion protein